MKHKNLDEFELYVLAAASLRSEGKKQIEIAQSLKISQSEVSRLLKAAKKNKWLKQVNPRFVCPSEALRQRMQMKFFSADRLLRELKLLQPPGTDHLRKISVIHGARGQFSRDAARAVEELVRRARVMGVTWGRTIRELVAGLREHFVRPKSIKQPIQLVPLCGEPLKDRQDPLKYSSSTLAAELDELINGNKPSMSPSLAGVPAFIPACFNKTELKTIRRFICQVAGYGSVFGEDEGLDDNPRRQRPWVTQLDTILTSVGIVAFEQRGIFLKERVDLKEIGERQLVEAVVGDIGGIIIPRRGLSGDLASQLDDLNERWTGIKEKHLRACAQKAVANQHPGVIVLAVGEAKAEMVCRCVELGLVNELIMDRALARRLES